MEIVIGVSDMKVSNHPESVLITRSLGSCIGMVIYDSVAKAGGILHFMLPESNVDPDKASKNPYMFADTGIPSLFKSVYTLGAKKQRMKVIVVGGGTILDQKGFFNIGKRNYMAAKKMLWKNNVIIDYEDVGGNVNRTIKLALQDGRIWLKTSVMGETEI
ncbi:MAG: chemotaxis protein CheD [Thermodesulfobacteriota bacterium]|nr:chemotaxis protein CheD [Thermodesulfobacteriota bacterium]